MLEHNFEDGKCIVCGAADPDYEPTEPSQPTNSGGNETESPQTGGGSSLALWSAVLLVSGGALGMLTIKRKKR
ncbi:MAG: LPXTG cell wall anchor domain-containing protein [Clostridiales bacterium]|nr:LPXTG cell wall anchor domain-containing protein [Clostridiales bacterium]